MHKKFQNYIFDLDGTLIDSSEEILNCLKKSFNKANIKISENKFTSDIVGPPIRKIIENISANLSNDEINIVIKNFRQIYDNDINDISKPYFGICETLNLLEGNGKSLFIATNKPKIPTLRIVNKFFPKSFNDIYTIDKFEKTISKTDMIKHIIYKYSLSIEKTVMIGDAASDVIAAKEAGVIGIGALWGYGSDKTKLISNADFVIKEIKEI